MEFKKLSEMKKNYYHCKAEKNNIIIDLHEVESDPFISKVLEDLVFSLKAAPEDKEICIDLEFQITHV